MPRLSDATPEDKRRLTSARFETLKHVTGDATADDSKKDVQLWNCLLEYGYDGATSFKNFKVHHWKFYKLFWNIQRYNQCRQIKNFVLFPIFKQKRQHVRYDTKALHELLVELDLFKGTVSTFTQRRLMHWRHYFRIPQKHINGATTDHRFDFSVATDGVAITIHMKRQKLDANLTPAKKEKKRIDDEAKYLARVRRKLRQQQYTCEVGIDPGRRLMMGGVVINKAAPNTSQEDQRVLVKYKSAEYRYHCGEHQRKKQYTKWCAHVEIPYNRELSLRKISPMHADPYTYTHIRLEYFSQRQEVLAQRKVTRLSFKKYIQTEQTLHELARDMVKGHEDGKTLVFIGNTQVAQNCPNTVTEAISAIKGKICRRSEGGRVQDDATMLELLPAESALLITAPLLPLCALLEIIQSGRQRW